MDPLTHLAAGVVCSRLLPGPSRAWSVVAGAIFALLPDVDYFLVFGDRLAFLRYHRGITHSLLALPLLALLGAGLGRAIGGPRWFRPLFLLGVTVLASHVLLDLATSYGTQILNPLSTRRFSLDLVFIIDPYLTALLLLGAGGALYAAAWGRTAAFASLAAAGLYLLICGLYQHQALALAQRLWPPAAPGVVRVAALPQPLSCRRWHLLAAAGPQIREAFVELPWGALLARTGDGRQAQAAAAGPPPDRGAPGLPYQPPQELAVRTWTPASAGLTAYSPEAREILERFLEFARFPLLHCVRRQGRDQEQEWLDLRFAMPQRAIPFVLHLDLDEAGRLKSWAIGGVGRTVQSYGRKVWDLKSQVWTSVQRLMGSQAKAGPYPACAREGEGNSRAGP
jgi:inner membrane protein